MPSFSQLWHYVSPSSSNNADRRSSEQGGVVTALSIRQSEEKSSFKGDGTTTVQDYDPDLLTSPGELTLEEGQSR